LTFEGNDDGHCDGDGRLDVDLRYADGAGFVVVVAGVVDGVVPVCLPAVEEVWSFEGEAAAWAQEQSVARRDVVDDVHDAAFGEEAGVRFEQELHEVVPVAGVIEDGYAAHLGAVHCGPAVFFHAVGGGVGPELDVLVAVEMGEPGVEMIVIGVVAGEFGESGAVEGRYWFVHFLIPFLN